MSFNSLNKTDLNIDSKMLNNNAEKKLVTINPPTKLAANKIMIALITNKNNNYENFSMYKSSESVKSIAIEGLIIELENIFD